MADYKGTGDELVINATPGELLDEFAARAVKECREYGGAASATFNGATIHIGTGWEATTVARQLDRRLLEKSGLRGIPNVTIGPINDAKLEDFKPHGWSHPEFGTHALTGSDKGPEPRLNVLAEAARVVSGDRQHAYGSPKDNHSTTAAMWTAYLTRKYGADQHALDARDVCFLNALQKISRDANRPKRDNLIDIAGYMRNAEMLDEADE